MVAVVETYSRTFVEPSVIKNDHTLASVVRKQDTNGEDMTILEPVNKQDLEAATEIT